MIDPNRIIAHTVMKYSRLSLHWSLSRNVVVLSTSAVSRPIMSTTVRLVENSTTLPISQNSVPSQLPWSAWSASPWTLMKSKLSASVAPTPT